MGKKLRKNLKPETPATIYFEVAPDPDNRALAAKWRGLSHCRKPIITRRAALAVIPKALETLKLEGEWEDVLGGYLGETNPCLAVHLNRGGRALELAKLLGHVCAQQSMMIVSDYPQRDLEMLDLLTIELPGGFTATQVTTLYDRLWRRGRRLVGGHTTRFNEMRILNLSGIPTVDLVRRIGAVLKDEYRMSTSKAWGAFVSKERYYEREENGTDGSSLDGRRVSEQGDYLRWRVGSILKIAFETERKGRRP